MGFATLMGLVGSNIEEDHVRIILASQDFPMDDLSKDDEGWCDKTGNDPVLMVPDQGLIFEIDPDGRVAKFVVIGRTKPDSGITPHTGPVLAGLTMQTHRVDVWSAMGPPEGQGETRSGHPWDIWFQGDLSFRFVYGNTPDTANSIEQLVTQPAADVRA